LAAAYDKADREFAIKTVNGLADVPQASKKILEHQFSAKNGNPIDTRIVNVFSADGKYHILYSFLGDEEATRIAAWRRRMT
jgi:hypothetical protein